MRQPVTQEDDMGCGIACVAFIVSRSYGQVAGALDKRKAQKTGFHLKEMRLLLEKYGFTYRQGHVNLVPKARVYAEGSIVFIARSHRYLYGHYLVRSQGVWMDPWINLPYGSGLKYARSGFRQRLPGRAQWVIYASK